MEQKEILYLLEKLKSNSIKPRELERLKHLINSSNEVKEFLNSMNLEYEKIQQDLHEIPAYQNQAKTKARLLNSIEHQNNLNLEKKIYPFKYLILTLAACSIIIAGIFIYQKKEGKTEEIVWQTISTTHGEQKLIKLDDNTIIKLNGNSSLSYPKSSIEKLRLVKLQGEAYFNVAKDVESPFLILCEDFVTRVVGTTFNIDSDLEKSVEVNSGHVKVYKVKQVQYSKELSQDIKNLIKGVEEQSDAFADLSLGQKAILSGKKWEVKNFNNANWYNNEFVHINEQMGTILKKAFRFYGDSIVCSPEILESRITITFKNKSIEQVLQTLADINDAKLIKKPNHIWEIKDK